MLSTPALQIVAWLIALLSIGVAVAFMAGRRRMMKFRKRSDATTLPDPAPHVSILVPVKDEVHGIERCVRDLLAQDYPAFDVYVINDRSTDGTGDVLQRLLNEGHPRLHVMSITDLPDGWLGKPHALHSAVAAHREQLGQWLLLVDSDVVSERDALRRTVADAAARGFDLVSLVTGVIAPTFLEKLVTPIVAAVWAATFRIADTNVDTRRASAAANGQFMLVRKETLLEIGGHAAVRDRTCEDVEIARLIKGRGGRTRFYMGSHLVRTRMHHNWRQMFNGWARNLAGTARHRVWRVALAILVLALFAATFAWLPLAGTKGNHVALIGLGLTSLVLVALAARVYHDAGRSLTGSVGLALLLPVTLLLVEILLLNAVRACMGGSVQWRGSTVRA